MLKIVSSRQFKRDLKLAKKRGNDLLLLAEVVDKLASEQKLEEKYHDHNLNGNYAGFRECHVEPDWLLVYRIENEDLELFLFRTGSHADLF